MKASIHYTSGNCVTTVTPTMEALGDQPYICKVSRHTRSQSITETFVIEAGSRNAAAQKAQEVFNENHGCNKLDLSEIIPPRRIA